VDPAPPVLLRGTHQAAADLNVLQRPSTPPDGVDGEADRDGLAGGHRELLAGRGQGDGGPDADVEPADVGMEQALLRLHRVTGPAVVRPRVEGLPEADLTRKPGDAPHDPGVTVRPGVLAPVVLVAGQPGGRRAPSGPGPG